MACRVTPLCALARFWRRFQARLGLGCRDAWIDPPDEDFASVVRRPRRPLGGGAVALALPDAWEFHDHAPHPRRA